MTEVVVTGIGLITPIATGTEAFWSGLLEGRSGTAEITAFDASELPVRIAAELGDFDPTDYMSKRDISRSDRFSQIAVGAASLAWDEAECSNLDVRAERIGVIIGTGIGGLPTIEREHTNLINSGPRRVSPFMVPKLMPNAAAGAVAMKFSLTGPNYAPTSACASGAHAVGEAYRYVRDGLADVMIAGGTESALTPLSLAAFARMGALSRRNDDPRTASRPFDAGRDGFVFGEGAGVLVLERREAAEARDVHIYGSIIGYGASADAFHITQPDPKGTGAVLAMKWALADAGLSPEEVHYINAHGTSTPYNDRVETIAIKEVFGPEAKRVPVSSTKSNTGHLLGAAGAVEAAVSLLALERQTIPPTINWSEQDPDCDLDYVPEGPRSAELDCALSNSFGFGGQNACLAFRARY